MQVAGISFKIAEYRFEKQCFPQNGSVCVVGRGGAARRRYLTQKSTLFRISKEFAYIT